MRRQSHLLLLLVLLVFFQAFARTRPEEYALILEGTPLAPQISSRKALHSAEAVTRLKPILSAQQALRQELTRRKIPVTGSAQILVNAVFVRVPRERVAELQSMPGVKRVVWMPPIKRHLNTAVDLVNVTTAWNTLGGTGNAGAGIKIGILDSGIDDLHPAFQDNSLQVPANFPKGITAYTNHKIIVARNYEPMFPLPDDPTPVDRTGHGTALAMIAAGATNKGPLATITGVAPKAWLGNYKIFGSPGVNDTTTGSIVVQALEDAYNDGMDIVVLAFGYPAVYGPLDKSATACAGNGNGLPQQYQNACDVTALAVENAVTQNKTSTGMTVVVSAGNDAQTSSKPPALNSINSPGTAPSAITVGASTNSHIFFASVHVNGSNVPSGLQTVDAVVGDGPKLSSAFTAPLRDVSTVDSSGLACSPLPGGSFTGDIVLIERGNCDFAVKINNAADAGAAAVILYQDASVAGALPFGSLGAQNTGIPAMMVGNADGLALKSYVGANPNAQATLDPALREMNVQPNFVAEFSSRGPSIDYAIKPELVAVGKGLYTATQSLDPDGDLYDASGYTSVDGSSFATAMVAGAAALVKQANPNFSPAEIKSALILTASAGPNDINDYTSTGEPLIAAIGGGKLNASAALAPGVTVDVVNSAIPNAHPGTVSFGWVGPSPSPAPPTISLNITNTLNVSATFSIFVNQDSAFPDSSNQVTVSPNSAQLSPGQTMPVQVTLTGSFPNAGTFDGTINIQGPSTNVYIPYWYLVSDGTPFDLMPVIGSSFVAPAGVTCQLIAFKVTDQYGVAVPNQPVTFTVPNGAALSTNATCPAGVTPGPDAKTDSFGIAAAHVDVGSTPGSETFQGTVQGLTNASAVFFVSVPPGAAISSVVDAASFQVGKGLAPGSYIAIYGSGMGDATQLLSTNFLPFGMSSVSVSFLSGDGKLSLPGRLWYVSPTQVNVQIPWELAGQTSAKVYVTYQGWSSSEFSIPIADSLPAMFKYNSLAIAQDPNYQLITASNPARRGQNIILYANGLGPVNNTPPTGEITPSQPFANTVATPTVTIGNAPATVLFSGLTPGSIGLYQLNVTVPANAPTGLQPVVITTNVLSSQPANLPVQ